jgi:ribonuclease P protein component
VLSPLHRLTSPKDFRRTIRSGTRAGSPLVVVHYLASDCSGTVSVEPARVGFVVSRAIGNAVVRNRVKRRLRHACRARVDTLGPGSMTVVRAMPAASAVSFGELDKALGRCLARAHRHAGSRE